MFRPPVPGWAWSLAGGAFGLWAPLWQGLAWDSPVGLLALGTVVIWSLARAEKPFAFGFVVAAVTLIRPFAAIHIVVVCGWKRRASRRRRSRVTCRLLAPLRADRRLAVAVVLAGIRCRCICVRVRIAARSVEPGAAGGQAMYAMGAVILAWLRWRGLRGG